jgi:2-dehydro-3-deoxyglucarate aldolase/4-hydroxy-2-oxoheptanedioate aldolase
LNVNRLKKSLKEGQLQLGCMFAQLRQPAVATILGKAGLDWCWLDTEHGPLTNETLQDLCRAAIAAGMAPIVRVADSRYDLVARSLDMGAMGVMLPRIESPEVLRKAVSSAFYPPLGVRGYGFSQHNVDYEPVTMAQIIEHVNANTMMTFQIETRAGLDARDELCAVPGVDAVMVGPADLSIALGVAGEFEHPKLVDAIDKIIESCVKHGIAPGIHMRPLHLAKFWRDRGMKFLSTSGDALFLFDKAQETMQALRG